jgi:hypothetical protein
MASDHKIPVDNAPERDAFNSHNSVGPVEKVLPDLLGLSVVSS